MLGDGSFGGFAHVVPQMPPVGDLDGLRGAGGRALSEERGPIPADDLDARPFGEPGRKAGRLPVGQQVDRPTDLDIDQDGPVVPSFAGRVLVDTDHPRSGQIRLGQ